MTEWEEVEVVHRALGKLANADRAWRLNFNNFDRLDGKHRILWWRGAKRNAAAGVPAMQKLYLKFITERLVA